MSLVEKGTLEKGLTIGSVTHKNFEMGPIENAGQLFDAEMESDIGRPLEYHGALMCRQLKKIGDFTGPFTMEMIRKLSVKDYNQLRAAQLKLDAKSAEDATVGKPDASA